MIENTYGIYSIVYKPTAICFCPLGQDYYRNRFEVVIEPNKFIPDYCELDKWIEENINGETLIIEEAVAKLHEYIEKQYKPLWLNVTSHVARGRHSEVIVSK